MWVLVASLVLLASRAHGLVLLTADKVAIFTATPGRDPAAVLRVDGDGALRELDNPTCPATSSLRFALSRRAADFEDHGEIALSCARWQARGSGYRYLDPDGTAGGVREIVYRRRRLLIRARGPGFQPVGGPAAYVEAWLTIGSTRYLLRFHAFRRNEATRIVTRRPSRAGAAGEAAFFDTLWADRPRGADALRFLRKAVRQDPRDGRSHFLLGMLHLYRAGGNPAEFDFSNLSDAAKAEQRAGNEHLDRAVELLPNDTRVPGFRAAATYANGFVHGDAELTALGLRRLDEVIALNPLFNSFDLFAVVAPTISGTSDFYQSRVLALVDFVLKDNLSCPATVPEICSNVGMAPRNIEGTFLLLGDIYAKGGRLADAEMWYGLAQAIGPTTSYRYRSIADDRVAGAAERVARSLDADPTNDLPLLGGGGASCIYCHNK